MSLLVGIAMISFLVRSPSLYFSSPDESHANGTIVCEDRRRLCSVQKAGVGWAAVVIVLPLLLLAKRTDLVRWRRTWVICLSQPCRGLAARPDSFSDLVVACSLLLCLLIALSFCLLTTSSVAAR